MDELTQVMLSVNGLSLNTSVYVRSKCPQTVEEAIREATTYDNVMAISKNNNNKFNPFLKLLLMLNATLLIHDNHNNNATRHHLLQRQQKMIVLNLAYVFIAKNHPSRLIRHRIR
ncbi:unnamed protein product [Rotaria socialis]|uniref:Uncharacterized protein n=1 Tax=Rotaria socialis TaxID=392032 RepID=A0A817P755_9BILA|nr:unnamed protein product [Rotaria socialis]CAF3563582.1 unnamed protein product [Rotaria socialis]